MERTLTSILSIPAASAFSLLAATPCTVVPAHRPFPLFLLASSGSSVTFPSCQRLPGRTGFPLRPIASWPYRFFPARYLSISAYPSSVFWSSVSTLIRLATVVTLVFRSQLPMSQRRYWFIQVWSRIPQFLLFATPWSSGFCPPLCYQASSALSH